MGHDGAQGDEETIACMEGGTLKGRKWADC